MVNCVLHVGHGIFTPLLKCPPYFSKHFKQTVCTHGSDRGSVNESEQIGHSVMSSSCSSIELDFVDMAERCVEDQC